MKNILIFGASGSIGNYLFQKFTENNDFTIFGTTRNDTDKNETNMIHITIDNMENLLNIPNIDAIIWAQGYNTNDNIFSFNKDTFSNIIDANVTFILDTLHFLLYINKINNNAKMVIISSIWENFTRNNKLSYSISKAALSSLVKNLSYDLSKKNILINNVLPGVIDNDMTRKTLNTKDIEYITNYNGFQRMIHMDDVYNTVLFLIHQNTGITGQSIVVDLGFSSIRKYS